jgi:hypothetical protein
MPFEDDVCPVGDELLGEVYRKSKQGLTGLVATIPPYTRAMLALFCYRRSHFHEIGLAIAASCSEEDLMMSGGRLGAALFARSREEGLPPAAVAPRHSTRRTIRLATPFGLAELGGGAHREPLEAAGALPD